VPDLNWELWRLRQSDEVARHLRREAALAAVRESRSDLVRLVRSLVSDLTTMLDALAGDGTT
jgi:hypothetical protein